MNAHLVELQTCFVKIYCLLCDYLVVLSKSSSSLGDRPSLFSSSYLATHALISRRPKSSLSECVSVVNSRSYIAHALTQP
jgi:hypothetical protein